jgi:mono/diheme cytochrome c family protein
MNGLFRTIVIGLATVPLVLTGCSSNPDSLHPAYSVNVKYGVRTDPILMEPGAKLGDERFDPDRPGILPIMKVEDALKPDHPYVSKKDSIDKVLRDPLKISSADRAELEKQLEFLFGTPAKPTVNAKAAGIDEKLIAELHLDDDTLAKGSTRYRIHCLHCHGVPGDGRGPTARWINPHPRDFRQAIFKFQSVDQTESQGPPARADIVRTIRYGLEGTAMPSFNLLKDDEIEALASYVIHLSLRGEAEFTTIKAGFAPDGANGELKWIEEDDIEATVKFFAKKKAALWRSANDPANAIKVAEYPYATGDVAALKASVKRGRELFTANPSDELKKEYIGKIMPKLHADAKASAEARKRDEAKAKDPKISDKDLAAITLSQTELAAVNKEVEKQAEANTMSFLKGANCVSCHVDYGRQARFRFDDWGTLVRPNNFTQGNFRGGKRPVDVYYRIHSGIRGSGMQNFGKTFKGQEQYIWDLVNFVTNMSYPAMRERLDMKLD